MNRSYRLAATLALAALAGTVAIAQPAKDSKAPAKPAAPAAAPAGQPEMQLPPGWTMEDMQACMEAGTPGEMHAYLATRAGTWHGKSKMWMSPELPPMESTCTTVMSVIMDGRYIKNETTGEFPGMGPYTGSGTYGYNNVSEKFECSWFDNHSTGMMFGTGELSSDGKTLTWNFTYHCPLNKKPCIVREIERHTSKDAFTLEMHGTDPKSGKEYKMMEISYTRQPAGDSHSHADHKH